MWFKIINQQVEIKIFVKTNAKQTTLIKKDDQELHIALHAQPYKGEANKELIAYLAKLFKLRKNQIILKRGEHSKHKTIILPLTMAVNQFLK